MSEDETWEAAKKVWEQFDLPTIARAFVFHHQMVNAIAADQGGDEFAAQEGGISCRVRRNCVPFCGSDGKLRGVEVVELVEDDISAGSTGMRYPKPVITPELAKENVPLMEDEKDFLLLQFVPDSHDDPVATAVFDQCVAWIAEDGLDVVDEEGSSSTSSQSETDDISSSDEDSSTSQSMTESDSDLVESDSSDEESLDDGSSDESLQESISDDESEYNE